MLLLTGNQKSIMKTKIFLSILALGLIVNTFGQRPTLELTFTAKNNGQYIPVDSIFIENLTQEGDTTLFAPDTVLVLDYISSIVDKVTNETNTFIVSQNYPNPFMEKTEVNLYLLEEDNVEISIRDVIGRELTHYKNTLYRGTHSFLFYPGDEKYYLLTITGKRASKTIKMLNANINSTYGEKCKIVYNGYKDNLIGFKSQKDIKTFDYNIGDELNYIAYTDYEDSEIIDSPLSSQNYTFQFDGWTSCPGSSTVTDIDNNTYNTVLIGDQCWMKENLKTTTYNNNTPIPNVTDPNNWGNLTTGAYILYNNNIYWKNLYGVLYNWYAVDDTNGLCPIGWHLPTDDEWKALTDFIGGTDHPHGNELKSCRQVNSPLGDGCNTTEHPRWGERYYFDWWGTDDYGFSAFPGGFCFYQGTFFYIGEIGKWWTSTETSSGRAWFRKLSFGSGTVFIYGKDYKRVGSSVRCLRD